MTGWIRRHRGLTAFAAGVLLTLAALAVVAYAVVSDQRRSARVLAVALSQALSREVRIDRVTEVGTARVVMRGVSLSRDGGWPADLTAEKVEVTGPLLAAARGDAVPVRLIVTRPTVTVPAPSAASALPPIESLRQGIASFLEGPAPLEVSMAGGRAEQGNRTVEFDLALRKGSAEAKGELTIREPRGSPLTLTVDARMDGDTARLSAQGRGTLAALSAWLPEASATVIDARPLTLSLNLGLSPTNALRARGGLAVGDVVAADGEATFGGGTLRVSVPRAAADLGFAAAVAGLPWQPTGYGELSDVTVIWRPDAGVMPTVRAEVRLPALALPAAGVGTDVAAERVEGRLELQPATTGLTLQGEARAARVSAAGIALAPVEASYRVSLDSRWNVARVDVDALRARVDGAALQGGVGYDVGTRRVDGELTGDDVEVAGLVRRLAPGWLAPADRLHLTGLRLTAKGLDPRGLHAGAATLEARAVRLSRTDGELGGRRTLARVGLDPRRITVALEAAGLASTLPVLQGEVPTLTASAALVRQADGTLQPERADLTARDAQRRDLVVAALRPAAQAQRFALSAHAPALDRLDGLWPAFPRRVNGSARADVEVSGPGLRAADGRFTVKVPEGELFGGRVSVRDLAAEIPVRRGADAPGEPPWGLLEIGEVIGAGLVVRDLTTPARVWNDRMSLNDLTYALYSGVGKGWTEVELEAAGLHMRGKLTGERVRIEEFVGAYGIRGGTMTGLLRYAVDVQYRAARFGVNGRLEVPEGGTVNIELLNRLLAYAPMDPTGVLRSALENLRAFDYKSAEAEVHSTADDILVSLTLRGRERFLILPPKVREINIRNMPVSFLARQFPGN